MKGRKKNKTKKNNILKNTNLQVCCWYADPYLSQRHSTALVEKGLTAVKCRSAPVREELLKGRVLVYKPSGTSVSYKHIEVPLHKSMWKVTNGKDFLDDCDQMMVLAVWDSKAKFLNSSPDALGVTEIAPSRACGNSVSIEVWSASSKSQITLWGRRL